MKNNTKNTIGVAGSFQTSSGIKKGSAFASPLLFSFLLLASSCDTLPLPAFANNTPREYNSTLPRGARGGFEKSAAGESPAKTVSQSVACAHPRPSAVNSDLAIRAIIGEAGNQGYTGMLAIAGAIRNRGTLKGVYGVKAKHINKEPKWVWDMAKKAWLESATNDITNGAQYWGSIHCDKNWLKKMELAGYVKTFEYKGHKFYKEDK